MTEQNQKPQPQPMYALTETQLGVLQEYFLTTPMPYKQAQPYVQMLTSLPQLSVTQESASPRPPEKPPASPQKPDTVDGAKASGAAPQ